VPSFLRPRLTSSSMLMRRFSFSPVELHPHPLMADRHPLHCLLRCCLVCLPLYHQPILEEAQLVPSRIRLWSRRATIHSDLVGHLRHWLLSSLGWWLHLRGPCFAQSLAVARSLGFNSRPRLWCYSPADLDKGAHVLRPHCISSAGFHRNYLCQSLWS
jgi:hypothetical protein